VDEHVRALKEPGSAPSSLSGQARPVAAATAGSPIVEARPQSPPPGREWSRPAAEVREWKGGGDHWQEEQDRRLAGDGDRPLPQHPEPRGPEPAELAAIHVEYGGEPETGSRRKGR